MRYTKTIKISNISPNELSGYVAKAVQQGYSVDDIGAEEMFSCCGEKITTIYGLTFSRAEAGDPFGEDEEQV